MGDAGHGGGALSGRATGRRGPGDTPGHVRVSVSGMREVGGVGVRGA